MGSNSNQAKNGNLLAKGYLIFSKIYIANLPIMKRNVFRHKFGNLYIVFTYVLYY